MTTGVSPTDERRPGWFLAAMALAYAGGVIAYLPLLSLLLPLRIDAVAPNARLGVMTACIVAGALAASGSNLLFGVLSDRSLARGRGRRRWMAGGAVLTLASYQALTFARSPTEIVLAVAAFQVAVNALLAPLLAIVADEVSDARRGLAGGLLALGAPVASGVAVLLIASELGTDARLLAVPLISAACVVPLLLVRLPVAPASPAAPRDVRPRRNLSAMWVARLLVQVAGVVLSTYLLFYFDSIVPIASHRGLASRVADLLLIAALLPLPAALLAGRLSDRRDQRKPVLALAATVAAVGLIGMAWAHDWPTGALAFALYTVGASVFLALHATFAMQLLPEPGHRGRDLGLLNLTNTLPALIGPVLTWQLATPRNFAPVLYVLAGLTLCGGIAILAVRGRR